MEDSTGRLYQLVSAHIGRMMLELETAGNIRLEEGRPTDQWCVHAWGARGGCRL